MILCNKCNKENKSYNEFCEFCGFRLRQKEPTVSVFIHDFKKTVRSIKKHKMQFFALSIFSVTGLFTYYVPKITNGMMVNETINNVIHLEKNGEYEQAFRLLAVVDSSQLTNSKKEEIEDLKKREEKFVKYKDYIEVAKLREEDGRYGVALGILRLIDSSFPEYKEVSARIRILEQKENSL